MSTVTFVGPREAIGHWRGLSRCARKEWGWMEPDGAVLGDRGEESNVPRPPFPAIAGVEPSPDL